MKHSAMHWLNRKDIIIPKNIKHFGDKFEKYDIKFDIIRLPGHTPGGIGFYNKNQGILFSGDLIFKESSIGRTDFSYSSDEKTINSLSILKKLPKNTIVFPGHGEKFKIKDFNFKYYLSDTKISPNY